MAGRLLIVGQGLAGTVLGWALEGAGIEFEIADAGHENAASRVAAGIINPITGRRLVKSEGVDALLPQARACYREIEQAWGVSLWREMRVWRMFADEREREVFQVKYATDELSPYAKAGDASGFWIEGAARVDLPALIGAGRKRWKRSGVLREERVKVLEERRRYDLVIDCTGAGTEVFGFVDWKYSKGECLTLQMRGLDPGVILNRRHWVLPIAEEAAIVGATHEPGRKDTEVSDEGRETLLRSLAEMKVGDADVIGQAAGVRVYSPDKRPVIGLHPREPGMGVLNGLGAKGALHVPTLAEHWVRLLRGNAERSFAADVRRFWSGV